MKACHVVRTLFIATWVSLALNSLRGAVALGQLLRMLHLNARDATARDPLDGEFRAAVFDGVAPVSYTHLTLPTIYSV